MIMDEIDRIAIHTFITDVNAGAGDPPFETEFNDPDGEDAKETTNPTFQGGQDKSGKSGNAKVRCAVFYDFNL